MSATIISVQCQNRYSASPKFVNGTWIFSIHENLRIWDTEERNGRPSMICFYVWRQYKGISQPCRGWKLKKTFLW